MGRILVIGYERMFYFVEEVFREKFPNNNVEIERIELERRMLDQLFQMAKKPNPPIVITSDRISLYLKKRVPNLPVISVDVSEIEIVEKLKKACTISDRIVIMDFYKKRKIPSLEFFNTQIKQVTFLTGGEIESKLRELKKQGWSVIIGGNLECNISSGMDLKPIYIYDKETVADSLEKNSSFSRKVIIKRAKKFATQNVSLFK